MKTAHTRKSARFTLLFITFVLFGLYQVENVAARGAQSAQATAPKVINIGTQQMPNDENIAKAKNYFASIGVEIKLLEFDSGSAVVNALVSNSIDLGLMGSTPATTAIANNLPVEVIWIHGILGKSEALVAKNSAAISSIPELAGKKVATPFGSTAHYSLLSALELNGVSSNSLTILDMQPKDIFAAWQRGDIDAAYVWDPVLGSLQADGVVITTSEQLAEQGVITADLEVVNKNFGAKYPAIVASYIKVMSKAQDDYRNNIDDAIASQAKYFNISEEESKKQILGNVWLSARQQLEAPYLGTSGQPGELAKALKKTADFLVAQKSITSAPELAVFQKAINPKYIELSLE
jgi:taurine transport system substrate-binding protein